MIINDEHSTEVIVALHESLRWLEHPEVLGLPFAGSPQNLATYIRQLLKKIEEEK